MQKNEITFILNDQEKIQVLLPCELDDIFRYDDIKAVYIKNNQCEYSIYLNDHIVEFIDVMNTALKEALTGDCKLDEFLQEDLGYLWNQYLNSFQRVSSYKNIKSWIGKKYLMWETLSGASWFYEKEGKFILEITPVYKWHSTDPTPEEKKEYVTYKQFIKNYKPYVVTEISQETIHEWLEQTKYLLALIESNDDKFMIKNEENEKQYQAFMEAQKKE